MDWAQILVIILSLFLAIFLLLGIILTVLLIRLTQQIKSVTTSAQRAASDIEGLVGNVSKFSSPALIIRMMARQVKKFKRQKEK